MITLGMSYQVLPGRETDFEQAFRGVNNALAGQDGHVATRLYRHCADDADYLILSEWRDRDSFDRFIHSDAFRRVTTWGTAEILRSRPSHSVYEDGAVPHGGSGHGRAEGTACTHVA